ncbi:hypothetical protein WR25_14024 [Diploscapter pachys]|uniref:Trafficking protein particle complex subunit n=1 Tax=Diploscapter pachys TaxID=2018661 RepID=A0A2A2KVH7_9BILA|nr:hypothetical protein WR25_14024 [Diploscapter pachys]
MSIYRIFIISRAGGLIYNWEPKNELVEIERKFDYPLDVILDEYDKRSCVIFGEKDDVKVRYVLTAVNGHAVSDTRFFIDNQPQEVLDYLKEQNNFPVSLRFAPPSLSTNEKIILSSTFHSLYAIAVQLSPAAKSTGIEFLETSQFKLHCLQSRTGVKFIVITSPTASIAIESLLNKIYEFYADYALKNPFHNLDMPIRSEKFEENLRLLLERVEKSPGAVTI